MKPFDLEKALSGEKVVTRSGLEITNIAWFESYRQPNQKHLLVVVEGDILFYKKDGIHHGNHAFDLFMAPKTETFWVGVRRYNLFGQVKTGYEHLPTIITQTATEKEMLIARGYTEEIYSFHEITREVL